MLSKVSLLRGQPSWIYFLSSPWRQGSVILNLNFLFYLNYPEIFHLTQSEVNSIAIIYFLSKHRNRSNTYLYQWINEDIWLSFHKFGLAYFQSLQNIVPAIASSCLASLLIPPPPSRLSSATPPPSSTLLSIPSHPSILTNQQTPALSTQPPPPSLPLPRRKR